jgi:hypothetical protein
MPRRAAPRPELATVAVRVMAEVPPEAEDRAHYWVHPGQGSRRRVAERLKARLLSRLPRLLWTERYEPAALDALFIGRTHGQSVTRRDADSPPDRADAVSGRDRARGNTKASTPPSGIATVGSRPTPWEQR